MKAFFLTASIILTVIVLIIAFGNIGATCSDIKFLFYSVDASPTIIILGVAVLGIITGAFYHAFVSRVLDTPDEEEEAF